MQKAQHLNKIHCSSCGRTIAVDDENVLKVTCPKCKAINEVDKKIHKPEKNHLAS